MVFKDEFTWVILEKSIYVTLYQLAYNWSSSKIDDRFVPTGLNNSIKKSLWNFYLCLTQFSILEPITSNHFWKKLGVFLYRTRNLLWHDDNIFEIFVNNNKSTIICLRNQNLSDESLGDTFPRSLQHWHMVVEQTCILLSSLSSWNTRQVLKNSSTCLDIQYKSWKTLLQTLQDMLNTKFFSHHNFSLNLEVIIFLTLSMFSKMSFSSMPQLFNQSIVSLHQHSLRRSWFWLEFKSILASISFPILFILWLFI